jgi:hypothetical protein
MEKKMGVALATAIIASIIAAFAWATIPLNFSFLTVTPNFKAMDATGQIQQLSFSQLATTVTYPTTTKIQFGATVTATLSGLASTRYKWWANYEVAVKSLTSNKQGKWDDFEGNWAGDSSWAAYWSDVWFTDSDNKFDIAPCKKAWWLSTSGWSYGFSDGWIPLDPNTYNSIGDWIKWSSGLGETPAGNYEVKVSLHIKVNFEDNYGKEQTAIGPGKSGEILDFIVFTIKYEAGGLSVTITPKTSFTWIPLETTGEVPDYIEAIGTAFGSNGLPSWTLHAIFTPIAAVAWILVFYYRRQ